jgi:hypothetical protein
MNIIQFYYPFLIHKKYYPFLIHKKYYIIVINAKHIAPYNINVNHRKYEGKSM